MRCWTHEPSIQQILTSVHLLYIRGSINAETLCDTPMQIVVINSLLDSVMGTTQRLELHRYKANSFIVSNE